MMVIYLSPLRLAIRTKLATVKWTLVWRNPQPFKTFDNHCLSAFHKPFLVGVFDTQNELSIGLARDKKRVKRVSRIRKVKSAGWRWR